MSSGKPPPKQDIGHFIPLKISLVPLTYQLPALPNLRDNICSVFHH